VVHVRLKVPSFMATLGTWFIGVGVANALLGGMAIRINDPWIRGLAIERLFGFPWGVWLSLVCLAVALLIQNYTRLGRYIYALGGGEELAALSGIPVARVRIVTFTLAGVFYAIGGVLAAAQLGLGNAQIGSGRLFTTITGVVVGGTALSGGQGGMLQTLVGVLIVVVLSNGMVLMGVPPSVQIGVQGLMIIAAVALSIDRKLMRIVK
jgi:ribose transport system permease protein